MELMFRDIMCGVIIKLTLHSSWQK